MIDGQADQGSIFEQRKRDHLRIALDPRAQSSRTHGLEDIDLIHEALPDLDFSDIDLTSDFNGLTVKAPYFVSSMTAGHERGREINLALAKFSERRGILMGVGSQRRELEDADAMKEWTEIRKQAPNALLLGNIGISQALREPVSRIQALVDNLGAKALFIHLNPLQECVQPEGTPQFRGGLEAIRRIARELTVPVIVKEVGCGFSEDTLKRLEGSGIRAVDVSGLGGTHWGRVEGQRLPAGEWRSQAAATFDDWGIPATTSLLNAKEAGVSYDLWASGGVRTGLDVAKFVAMGARFVGLAQPWLAAVLGEGGEKARIGFGDAETPGGGERGATRGTAQDRLDDVADRLDWELKTALFCTGCRTPDELRAQQRWTWR